MSALCQPLMNRESFNFQRDAQSLPLVDVRSAGLRIPLQLMTVVLLDRFMDSLLSAR
jgi:hypothetical protein